MERLKCNECSNRVEDSLGGFVNHLKYFHGLVSLSLTVRLQR